MKDLTAAQIEYRSRRDSVDIKTLVWITAKTRGSSPSPAAIGFWTGDDHQSFVIDGQTCPYFGAGNVLDVPKFSNKVGLDVTTYTMKMYRLTEEVEQAFSAYDARLAPVVIHRMEMDLKSGLPITNTPERIFKGWIDGLEYNKDAVGGTRTASITLASISRQLTIANTGLFSDSSQKLRQANDEFFKYVDGTEDNVVFWGQKRVRNSDVASKPASTSSANRPRRRD